MKRLRTLRHTILLLLCAGLISLTTATAGATTSFPAEKAVSSCAQHAVQAMLADRLLADDDKGAGSDDCRMNAHCALGHCVSWASGFMHSHLAIAQFAGFMNFRVPDRKIIQRPSSVFRPPKGRLPG